MDPADGREMPDCGAGGTRPQTLMSRSRSLKGEVPKKHFQQPPGVALELAPLGRGVAVAENQQIELLRRIARLVQLDQRDRRWPRATPRTMNLSAGSTVEGPDVLEGVPLRRAS